MKHPLMIRLLTLGLLTLLLFVPLWMVRDTIAERAGYQHQVQAEIARSWGGSQTLTGPMLVETWHTLESVQAWDARLNAYVDRREPRHHRRITFPRTLRVVGTIEVEERYRGIYAVPVYHANLTVTGQLDVPATPTDARELRQSLVLGIGDPRGSREEPEIQWEERSVPVEPGTDTALGSGIRGMLDTAGGSGTFRIELALGGSQRLDVTPVGGSSRLELASNWPHPGFAGGYLPQTRRIGPDGFQATWLTSRYAATARESLAACLQEERCGSDPLEQISVMLTQPLDVYALNDRSTKYGLLFVVVVFGVFFVYEALKRLRIHPVQYTLVGLAQALFFLLLLSLSEHVAFGWAYLGGTLLCVSLLAFYVSHVLGSVRLAGGFSVLLAGIYGALYVILLSEDYALITGSTLLLMILAGAMYLTRNVDWYALEASRART